MARFAAEVARDVRAGDELTAAVLERLGRRQATELVVCCAYYYCAVARVIETCGVELEDTLPAAGAFAEGDGDAMAACYAPEVHFSDPVFPDLRGGRAGAMWRMLTATPGDLRVELLEHDAGEESGSAHWRAHYTFTESGRPVVNDIQASLRFRDGLIAEHRDRFSFHRWARQALGPVGLALGWTPIVQGAVRRKAAARLDEFTRSDPAGHGAG